MRRVQRVFRLVNFWFYQFWSLVWIISRNSNQRISRCYFTIILGQKSWRRVQRKWNLWRLLLSYLYMKDNCEEIERPLQPLCTGLQNCPNIRILEGQWRYSLYMLSPTPSAQWSGGRATKCSATYKTFYKYFTQGLTSRMVQFGTDMLTPPITLGPLDHSRGLRPIQSIYLGVSGVLALDQCVFSI